MRAIVIPIVHTMMITIAEATVVMAAMTTHNRISMTTWMRACLMTTSKPITMRYFFRYISNHSSTVSVETSDVVQKHLVKVYTVYPQE